jgi:signal transduction histidine kinase
MAGLSQDTGAKPLERASSTIANGQWEFPCDRVELMASPNADENIGTDNSVQTRLDWKRLTPWFFIVWTLLVVSSIWWLAGAGSLKSGMVFSYDAITGKPWSMRLKEWLSLALLNFHWAIAWILLAPYVFWVASRFHLENGPWFTRVPILLVSVVSFVWACDLLSRRMGLTQDVIIMVSTRNVFEDVRNTDAVSTNRGVLKEEFFTSPFAGSNGPASEAGLERAEQLRERLLANFPPRHPLLEVDAEILSGMGSTNKMLFSRHINSARRRPMVFFAMDTAAWLALAGLAHAVQFQRRYREREKHAVLLSARLTDARLRALRNQLQPHFLFNALNGIATLVRRDPPAAHDMLTSLSELLRLALSQSDRQEIPLHEEIEFLDRYLEIQKMRFGDRLTISKEIEPGTLDCAVPPLVLQPLVENAIRHGIEPLGSPGCVRISARRADDVLVLAVEDNGAGIQSEHASHSPNGHGVGLASVRERLESLYQGRASLQVRNGMNEGVRAEVRLPFHVGSTPIVGVEIQP